jgi:hypothetical protein
MKIYFFHTLLLFKSFRKVMLFLLFFLNSLICSTLTLEKKDIEGVKVEFNYAGHINEREIAYQYYYNNNHEYFDEWHPFERDQIGIYLYDVDNDGNKEILAYLTNPGFCGSRGCHFEILKYSGESIQMGTSGVTVHEDMTILDSTSLGYHDINFNDEAIWRWNGKNYEFYKEIDKRDGL